LNRETETVLVFKWFQHENAFLFHALCKSGARNKLPINIVVVIIIIITVSQHKTKFESDRKCHASEYPMVSSASMSCRTLTTFEFELPSQVSAKE